ncbi:MAG: M2 family metallopeptidase [Polyangiaceae bacterium]|nr:M2 family metallopeptidase [Polyangiaceae bacterium]
MSFRNRSVWVRRVACITVLAGAACSGGAPLTPSPPAPAGTDTVVLTGPDATPVPSGPATVDEAKRFVADLDEGLRKIYREQARADWINQTYITSDTDQLAGDAKDQQMAYVTRKIKESVRFKDLAGLPPDVARQLELLRRGTDLPAPPDPKERRELADLGVSMGSTYATGEYCSDTLKKFKKAPKKKEDKGAPTGKAPTEKPKVCFTLGELSDILEDKTATYEERREAWTGWRTISVPMKKQYERFVELGNKGAKSIGYKDLGELWRSRYDMSPAELEADVERLWQQVKPLYDDLHCYARTRLQEKWGKDKIGDKALPAHVFGNMWSQAWGGIAKDLKPYPHEASSDITEALRRKKLDARGMVKLGEGFFTSLGLKPLPDTFWERSLFVKPEDRKVECHASAWDLAYMGGPATDVRIKMCTKVNEEDFITIHHELGHDYYYLYYNTLPILFQDGANDGFHEGIGDTLALSVTPAYLADLKVLPKTKDNDKAEINVLMDRALDKVAFLPFGLLIDKWRWDVFSGKISPQQYNKAWWDLVLKYQGIAPPEPRGEDAFDPGAKYHVPANVPYLRYFLAHIYQFQFHRALCKAAGHTGPLHKCSIFKSEEAGKKLAAMLAMGSSKPWPEAMKALSGETKADASALIEYFAPLHAWLKEQNKGKQCGW